MCVAEALVQDFELDLEQEKSTKFSINRQLCLLHLMFNPFRKAYLNRISVLRKLGWLLISFQLLDGFLTYLGLYLYGVDAEGNPLIKMAINSLGVAGGLSLAKFITISIIFTILIAGHKIRWLAGALRAVACFYFIFALAPWSYLILQAYNHTSL
jgi:hypothetical protein